MKTDFTIAAAALARAAPNEWKKFVEECKAHATTRMTECTQAQIAVLPTAQGRAQEAMMLAGHLEEAVAAADRAVTNKSRRT